MSDQRNHYEIDPEIEALLADLGPSDLEITAPPADIWSGIETRLAESDDDAADGRRGRPDVAGGEVVDLMRARAMRRSTIVLSMAAALVLIVVGIAVVAGRGAESDVLATARLVHEPEAFDPLGADASATARLVRQDGNYEIVLDDAALPTVDGGVDLELWLIETDEEGTIVDIAPVSLVNGAGTYVVPADLDVATHRIVDISIEPRDGDTAHSGRSILRGTLTEA
jgi:hypothetical protein